MTGWGRENMSLSLFVGWVKPSSPHETEQG